MPYFLRNHIQMNFELLGNSAVPDACQHVEVTQTKEAVKTAGNLIFFPLMWASCLAEIIMWRQHTRFASPVFSMHQMFFLTFCVELRRHSEQVSAPPQAKGQSQRKRLHHNQPLQIQLFTPPQKPSSHQLQAAQLRARSINSLMSWFYCNVSFSDTPKWGRI